jgi:(p)ppGpp synthase/HD superfamily hydrolase
MDQDKILEEITVFADECHGEQKRKYTPDRYIVHPIRVMKMLKERSHDLPLLAAALLHDVLEDTPVKKETIYDFLVKRMSIEQAVHTLKLVDELTDVFVKEAYPNLNRRRRKAMEMERMAKTSPEAQTVKYADIIDNCREIVSHDRDFAKIFLNECYSLLKKMPNGDPQLYNEALEVVSKNLRQIH